MASDYSFEPVHTVDKFYDGPREGVAAFRGTPHVYRALFSETDDLDARQFELGPISREVFELVMEAWAIWRRFEFALHMRDVPPSDAGEDWGALPTDRPRKRELDARLADRLVIDPARRVLAHAEFRARHPFPEGLPEGIMRPLEVRWRPVE